MNNPNQLFLIGGGYSAKEAYDKGILKALEGKFVIGLNLAFKFINPTFTAFVDPISFYRKYYDDIKDLPLLVGRKSPNIPQSNNTIFLKPSSHYTRDLSSGCYHSYLAGLWGLSLGIYLLDIGTIFLAGFNNGELPNIKKEEVNIKNVENKNVVINEKGKSYRKMSHWYQGKLEHRGIGKVNFYKDTKANKMFNVYKGEQRVSIFNVSPQSNLNLFPKINYDQMLQKMDNNSYDQEELRLWIKEKLKNVPKS